MDGVERISGGTLGAVCFAVKFFFGDRNNRKIDTYGLQ